MNLTEDDLDGHHRTRRYDDGTFVRLMTRRTDDTDAYPSGWRYALHYGATDADAVDVQTDDDGTIRRYDNAHEDAKGHELHLGSEPDAIEVDFPGMLDRYEQFWDEIPKPREDPRGASSDGDPR